MTREMVRGLQDTLTEMYKSHEIDATEYASLMEDTKVVGLS
jgi:hypothetical protein